MYKSIGDGFGKIMAAEGVMGFTLVSVTKMRILTSRFLR